jgi:hypothetical protein
MALHITIGRTDWKSVLRGRTEVRARVVGRRNRQCSSAARAPTRNPTDDQHRGYRRFGSWHPGLTQFAMGDASVQTVSSYAGGTTIHRMSNRQDGEYLRRDDS